jgi:peptidoglycan L-alanyl-D-glutamate endopeptidase CwlK
METKSIERINGCHPKIVLLLLAAYAEAVLKTPKGIHPYITEGLRSFERSDALYNQPFDGKDNDGDGKIDEPDERVSNVRGGSSMHNYGLAVDFVNEVNGTWPWTVDKNWMLVVSIFKKHGFKWGGDFKTIYDPPHFEMPFGYTIKQLYDKHKRKDFIPGTTWLNL